MKLVVQVDPRRDREGTLTLHDASGVAVYGPVPVCATADQAVARQLGNAARDPLRPGGHPPFGSYRFVKATPLAPDEYRARGPCALVFEPRTGDAVSAESHGRLLLELHGGAPGGGGGLRSTGGGLRVADEVVEELATRLRGDADCELELQAVRESWWSRLFRRRRTFGDDQPAESGTSWGSRDSSSPSEPAYSGRGGEFSGAGASGSWESASTGRSAAATGAAVSAGAAVAAAAVLAATESGNAAASDASEGAATGDMTDDSGVSEVSDSASEMSDSTTAESDSSSSDSDSETSTSTSY
ncbi:MAG: hypothetical protein EPO27_19120 [Betaproteobacteria bacterium]|nr:MAG: hypothetical protein EPO27_19120 [Betaproteobacteria bacterium]